MDIFTTTVQAFPVFRSSGHLPPLSVDQTEEMRILPILASFAAHVGVLVVSASASSATAGASHINTKRQLPPQSIPIIDISPLISPSSTLVERQSVANQINQACTEIGFFAITNHGISSQTIDALLQSSRKFFDMNIEDKLAAKSANDKEYPFGYERSEVLSKGKQLDGAGTTGNEGECSRDLKETYSLGPKLSADGQLARRWPPHHPADFISTHEEYYAAMEKLAHCLLRGFALALGLEEGYFRPYFDPHQCALRTLNYPQGEGSRLRPGQIRAGAHTDYGALTILKTGGPGLQVRKDIINDEEDRWIDAPDLEDAFIVNVGDMMRRYTNDLWVSTLHRVVVPKESVGGRRRQSIAFFVNARGDARVEPLPTCVGKDNPAKYEPVTAGEYLLRKHLASMGSEL